MSDDDENEIVCVRVLFSSFAPFLCFLQKKQKNSHQNAVVADFNDRTRNKFLPDRRDKKRVKKEERDSLMREKERKEERRAPFVLQCTTKKIGI